MHPHQQRDPSAAESRHVLQAWVLPSCTTLQPIRGGPMASDIVCNAGSIACIMHDRECICETNQLWQTMQHAAFLMLHRNKTKSNSRGNLSIGCVPLFKVSPDAPTLWGSRNTRTSSFVSNSLIAALACKVHRHPWRCRTHTDMFPLAMLQHFAATNSAQQSV